MTEIDYSGYDFSTITESESIEFVNNHNIAIPKKIENSEKLGEITRSIIINSYSDPNYVFIYNYGAMQLYADAIQDAVNSYNTGATASPTATSSYSLQYNTVKNSSGAWVTSGGAWNSRWLYYNCYAYAITRFELPAYYNHGNYIQYQPGNMSNSGSFDTCDTVSELAELVKADLNAIGHTNVTISDSILSVGSSQELICLKMGTTDYHLMRYDISTNAWYHKPGNSAILKYNSTPTNDSIWYKEYSQYGSEGIDTGSYYSEIKFIRYNKNYVALSGSSTSASDSFYIQTGKDSILEINNTTSGTYNFSVYSLPSYNELTIKLYDSDMNLLNTYYDTNLDVSRTLSAGTYYLQVSFLNTSDCGTVYVDIESN